MSITVMYLYLSGKNHYEASISDAVFALKAGGIQSTLGSVPL